MPNPAGHSNSADRINDRYGSKADIRDAGGGSRSPHQVRTISTLSILEKPGVDSGFGLVTMFRLLDGREAENNPMTVISGY
jgi:hypothetical protein